MMRSVQNAAASRHLPFAALLTVASAIRIFFDNVATFSPADETVYLRYTRVLADGNGYARIVRMYFDDPRLWLFPDPLRWTYFEATSLLCRLTGDCSYRTLAALSTVAGIAAVALTYAVGLQLFERRTAFFAAALVATSPLQLAMGRRALSDEFFCALVIASIATCVAAGSKPAKGPPVWLWVIVTTLAFGAKEQFALIYPVVLLFWWLRERKLRWEWLLPPFLDYAVFSALARDATAFFRVAQITTSTMNAPYAAQYQSGPPQRLLIDLMVVAPLVTIAFLIAAYVKRREPVLVLAAGILIVHSLISSKNLRYVISADPFMRLLVANAFPRKWFVIVNAAVELALFYAIFVVKDVYDPVTDQLLRALRMVPV
jgi:4-amino-4-deoxy-L-arabinose transferase-like glycosyltransferase